MTAASRRHLLLLGLGAGLAACAAPSAPVQRVVLPPGFIQGAGDPGRAAVLIAREAFTRPAMLQGNPAAAARAVALMEFVATEFPLDPDLNRARDALVDGELRLARAEWRGVLGIPADAPPQAVMDALLAASAALREGRDASPLLVPPLFQAGPEATLSRLAALPPLPATTLAATRAGEGVDPPAERSRQSNWPG